nr:PaRep2a protein [Pyrobaculum aerophilum]
MRREFSSLSTSAFGVAEELRGTFWWDGEWMGETLSCL